MITKLSHIGIVVNNIEEAKKLWTETYGLEVSESGVIEVEGVKNAILPIGNNMIELLEPIDHQDMSNAVARRLATRGEGIYQVALAVDDIDQEGKKLAERGVRLIKREPIKESPQGRWIVHPASANGVLLELVNEWP